MEKTLESPLDCKKIQPVHPRGNQSWIFIGRTDVEAETPILWPPDAKSWLIWKDPGAGKYWRQEEKGTSEDEMMGWHHQLNGHEFEWTLGVGDGLESLACCSLWGHKESDRTEWLNWTELMEVSIQFRCSIVSDSLRPHESWHTRPPCPSPTSGVTQTHLHWVSDAIQPLHPLSSPSPPALNLSQHQGLFKWVSSFHQVAKVLEFQLQHQSFQWTPRTDFL